ncbi:MAG: hypothetical protein ACXACW_16010 [Candidatus Hodarchaeales archaeon]|jgi:hypothetical protein
MRKLPLSLSNQHVEETKQQILEYYKTLLEKDKTPILSSGIGEKYHGIDSQSYPLDIFIEIPGHLIVIELYTEEILDNLEIDRILEQRFQLISQLRPIIAIIVSTKGFHNIKKEKLSTTGYPLVLTQNCQLIMLNIHAQWNKLINCCLFPNHVKGVPNLDTELLASSEIPKVLSSVGQIRDIILDGKLRTKIYLSLLQRPKYGGEIAQELEKNVSSVYRVLKELGRLEPIHGIYPLFRWEKTTGNFHMPFSMVIQLSVPRGHLSP